MANKTVLFINRNDIVRRTPLGGNIDPDRIMPFVYTAQAKWIWPTLGTVLYNKLQDDVEASTVTGVYQTLLEGYVRDTLIHYSVVEALPFISYQITQAGVTKYMPEGTTSVSKGDVDFLLEKELQTAQFFQQRLSEYLCAYNTSYPEYNQTTGKSDMIYPNKRQNYTMGWNL